MLRLLPEAEASGYSAKRAVTFLKFANFTRFHESCPPIG
jgi:hypothetical protein